MIVLHNGPLLLQVSGDVTYNGVPFSEFYPQRTAAYVDQVSKSEPHS